MAGRSLVTHGDMPGWSQYLSRGRAEPASPRGGQAQDRSPSGQSPQMARKAVSRRDALCASALQGRTRAEAFHFHPVMRQEAGWRTGHMPRSSASPPCGRGEPAPPGEAIQSEVASRGKPGDGAKAGFLGGTRFPRPCCEAGRKPGHNIIIGGKRTPGGLRGRSPDPSKVPLAGVRSPPLRGKACPARIDQRGESGDDAKGGFLGDTVLGCQASLV